MSVSVGWLLHEHILDTDESNVWGAPRFITFLAVVVAHLAVIALLTAESRIRTPAAATNDAVELLFIPPAKVPQVRFENARHPRLSDIALSITMPGLDSPSPSPASTGTDGDAPSVNWTAEAHRAVQAFEIRRNHPPGGAISSSTPWTDWWPQGRHSAGDQFKTPNGDWIVWISSNCYQIARWGPGAYGSTPPQTVCSHPPDASRRKATNSN
jgi:hypothetical protein